jgi:hypothetical protein
VSAQDDGLAAAGRRPDAHRAIARRRDHEATVRAESGEEHLAWIAREDQRSAQPAHLPDTRCPIVRSGDDVLPIWAESAVEDETLVSAQHRHRDRAFGDGAQRSGRRQTSACRVVQLEQEQGGRRRVAVGEASRRHHAGRILGAVPLGDRLPALAFGDSRRVLGALRFFLGKVLLLARDIGLSVRFAALGVGEIPLRFGVLTLFVRLPAARFGESGQSER